MRKLLIISYYYPNMPNIGALRPFGLAKYLPEFGWDPVIICSSRNINPAIGSEVNLARDYEIYGSIKKIFSRNTKPTEPTQIDSLTKSGSINKSHFATSLKKMMHEILNFPDENIGWYPCCIDTAGDLFAKYKFDAILSTSYPVTSHIIANQLARKYSIPWIADFRDLWSQNHYRNKYPPIQKAETLLEKRVLKRARFFTTVSEPLADKLRSLHKRNDSVISIINGFDEDDFTEPAPEIDNTFSIVYTGQLYLGRRDPTILFKAITTIIDERKELANKIRINFYGPDNAWVSDLAKQYSINELVRCMPSVSHSKALEIQRSAQLLLLLLWDNPLEEGVYTGKIFEYIGSKRPILAVGGPGGVVKKLLDDGNFGIHVNTLSQLVSTLKSYLDIFESDGVLPCSCSDLSIYSRKNMALNFANLLEKC